MARQTVYMVACRYDGRADDMARTVVTVRPERGSWKATHDHYGDGDLSDRDIARSVVRDHYLTWSDRVREITPKPLGRPHTVTEWRVTVDH